MWLATTGYAICYERDMGLAMRATTSYEVSYESYEISYETSYESYDKLWD